MRKASAVGQILKLPKYSKSLFVVKQYDKNNSYIPKTVTFARVDNIV